MTDDIVHRLRNPSHWLFRIVGPKSGATVQGESDAPREAADEIERLRADLDAYQKERDEEVVRLRVELAKERERADAHYRVLECVSSKRDALRELLREAREWIVEGKVDFNDALADRIDAALKGEKG